MQCWTCVSAQDWDGFTLFGLVCVSEVGIHVWSWLGDQLWSCVHYLTPQKHHPQRSLWAEMCKTRQDKGPGACWVEGDAERESGCGRLCCLPLCCSHSSLSWARRQQWGVLLMWFMTQAKPRCFHARSGLFSENNFGCLSPFYCGFLSV